MSSANLAVSLWCQVVVEYLDDIRDTAAQLSSTDSTVAAALTAFDHGNLHRAAAMLIAAGSSTSRLGHLLLLVSGDVSAVMSLIMSQLGRWPLGWRADGHADYSEIVSNALSAMSVGQPNWGATLLEQSGVSELSMLSRWLHARLGDVVSVRQELLSRARQSTVEPSLNASIAEALSSIAAGDNAAAAATLLVTADPELLAYAYWLHGASAAIVSIRASLTLQANLGGVRSPFVRLGWQPNWPQTCVLNGSDRALFVDALELFDGAHYDAAAHILSFGVFNDWLGPALSRCLARAQLRLGVLLNELSSTGAACDDCSVRGMPTIPVLNQSALALKRASSTGMSLTADQSTAFNDFGDRMAALVNDLAHVRVGIRSLTHPASLALLELDSGSGQRAAEGLSKEGERAVGESIYSGLLEAVTNERLALGDGSVSTGGASTTERLRGVVDAVAEVSRSMQVFLASFGSSTAKMTNMAVFVGRKMDRAVNALAQSSRQLATADQPWPHAEPTLPACAASATDTDVPRSTAKRLLVSFDTMCASVANVVLQLVDALGVSSFER